MSDGLNIFMVTSLFTISPTLFCIKESMLLIANLAGFDATSIEVTTNWDDQQPWPLPMPLGILHDGSKIRFVSLAIFHYAYSGLYNLSF